MRTGRTGSKRRISLFLVALTLVCICLNAYSEKALAASNTYDTVCSFPYKSKESAKIIKKYEKLIDSVEHVIPVETKFTLSSKDSSYKQTNRDPDYYYIGDVKKGEPNGFGALFSPKGHPHYIGYFKDGLTDSYGILFSNIEENHNNIYLEVEETYKNGKPDGKFYAYSIDYKHIESKEYSSEDFENSKTKTIDGVKLYVDPPIIPAYLQKEGTFKKGDIDGKFTLYSVDGKILADVKFRNNGKKAKGKIYFESGKLKYDGELNGSLGMDGKGTLYREDGSVEYKGKFKNGKIK